MKGRAILALLVIVSFYSQAATIDGDLKKWHKVTLTFDGPWTCENSSPNPFRDYRLNVTFTNGPVTVTVPGFYAADGNSAETSATCGNKWQVRFSPPRLGTWTYTAEFRSGNKIALATWSGTSTHFDGETGTFYVEPTDKTGIDFRGKGLLRYQNNRYLHFAETGERMIFGGAGSPENFLAYTEFDDTYTDPAGPGIDNTHQFAPHVGDWNTGDPVWQGTKGKGIIGAINYLSSVGMTSQYFLTFNEGGDGDDVWPWIGPQNYEEYDCSKLDQWEIVFSHMDKMGIAMHVLLQEQENDQFLNNGNLYDERKLYYRELVARFGHHLAIIWNLGEENTNSDWQRKQHASYLRELDVYNHLILTHTYPFEKNAVYSPLLGYEDYEGASLQLSNSGFVPGDTEDWIVDSKLNGRPWVVIMSEIGPSTHGVLPDSYDFDHDDIRKWFLWVHLMHGGSGAEWYFGYNYPHSDLTCEDFRSRENMFVQTKHAIDLWQILPVETMSTRNDLVSRWQTYCFANENKVYVVHLPDEDWTDLTLPAGNFRLAWYDPRTGGDFIDGGLFTMTSPGAYRVENAPTSGEDWVAIIWRPGLTSSARLDDMAGPASATVYPNPSDDHAVLDIPESEQERLVQVSDISGRVVLEQEIKAFGSATINTASLVNGTYMFRIFENKHLNITGRFEVMH